MNLWCVGLISTPKNSVSMSQWLSYLVQIEDGLYPGEGRHHGGLSFLGPRHCNPYKKYPKRKCSALQLVQLGS
ncbi:hypothetical protein LPU83_pLPU83b_0432 (plasmid) [Rhizobium favelukesii]|uniref:Uncharacterized protein n=1 Tax=Rhizobium favelukesii TaxID=348824 RepID=W6RGV4_9HYPH|nr:hypothetical protein LPU83_pLPU83b_0432 [Rhizobium favelukesii]